MTEVSTELIHSTLKQIREGLGELLLTTNELKTEMRAFRGHMASLQTDVYGIYTILDRNDGRLERIEKRLGLSGTTI